MKSNKRILTLFLALMFVFISAGCGANQKPQTTEPAAQGTETASPEVQPEKSHYPITVSTYDENGKLFEQVFESAPERVVSISQANTELLLELGLKDKIIATAHRFSPVYERLAEEYNAIPFIAEKGYPSKEVVLNEEPDMLIGWGSLFAEDAMGPVAQWQEKGIHTYLMNNTVTGLGDRTVEFLYEDIEKLGKIFDVEDRAQSIINDMKSRINFIQEKVSTIAPEDRVDVVTVQYVYENEFLGRGGTDFNRDLTELAGGIQVNDNGQQSMEVLIDLNPDVLVILDLSSSPAQEKIDLIKADPNLQNIKAVQNNRFVVLDHAAFYCGGPRTVEAIESLAKAFYPDLFSSYPVTISSYDNEGKLYDQVFEAAPERVVSNQPQAIQLLIALGLEDKIIGACRSVGDVNEKYKEKFEALNFISDNDSPSKEIVLDQNPDLIIGWGSTFGEKTLGPVSDWNEKNIATYIVDNSAVGVSEPRSVERLYRDIENLGKIFGIEERANQMIADMKNRLSTITDAVSGLTEDNKVTVLTVQQVYENEFFGRASTDFTFDLITKAGGICLDEASGKQSIENLINLNPDVIVVINRIDTPAQGKIDDLKANPSLASIGAIKNNRFVVLDYVDFYGGNYETIDAIEKLAKGFYPDLF